MRLTLNRKNKQTLYKGTIFLLLSLFIIQCSNNYVDDIDRSSLYQYEQGYPEVTFTSAGVIDQQTEKTQINVSAEIIHRSLIFKKIDSLYKANVLLEIQLFDKLNRVDFMNSYQFPLNISLNSEEYPNNGGKYIFTRFFDALPGDFIVNVLVTDLSTNKQTIRSSTAFIPDPNDNVSHITNIRVYSKESTNDSTYSPATSFDLSETSDSIKFSFQVTNNNSETALNLKSRLIKFNSDTTSARPLSWTNYTPSSLPYIGISYSKFDEIASSTRLIRQEGNVSIDFIFSNLQRGNYRFEVFTLEDQSSEGRIYRAREFSIKSKNYPTLKTPIELAAPLVYLMEKEEHSKLMSINSPLAMKREIDRFWLNNIKNQRIAQTVIQLYYERVEEANKQFSNFKEGWKTDLGMMYILFGPPRYINSSLNDMVWSYSTNLYDPETNFLFMKPKVKNKFYPFDNYILQRNQQYFSVQYQQIQTWLSGNILKDNL
jgi:GWxTD domain-containing protein